jgi:uncharacterized membrane protein
MTRILAAYAATAVTMAVLDFAWLSYFSRTFFEPAVGALLAPRTDMPVAVLFYGLYVAGVLFFAVLPARGWPAAFGMGAALGFFAYMTYDLTNMATLKVWPAWLAAMDIGWGTAVTALAAAAGYLAASRFS